MSPAQLIVDHLPEVGPGVKRFTIDCPAATTTGWLLPSNTVTLTDAALITSLALRHEEECQSCDLAAVWEQGDQELRRLVELHWARRATETMWRRRN